MHRYLLITDHSLLITVHQICTPGGIRTHMKRIRSPLPDPLGYGGKRDRREIMGTTLLTPRFLLWSGREDLNLRLHAPKACALAGLRHAPLIQTSIVSIKDTTLYCQFQDFSAGRQVASV